MTTKVTYVTPIGRAVWPKLDKPDQYINPKNPKKSGKPRYTINVVFTPEDLAKVQEDLTKLSEGMDKGDNEHQPWKEDKEGRVTLFAQSGVKFKPPLFDAELNKLPPDFVLRGGSKVRLDVSVVGFDGFGGGVTLYLNAVQVIEPAEEYKPGFGATEGFKYEKSEEADGAGEAGGFAAADEDDDSIPF